MDLDAFVTEHGAEWNRLQVLATKRRRKLTAAEIDELVTLYRRSATHLSVVRSRSGDPTLVAWLSRLVLQARAAITPSSGLSTATVVHFLTIAFPLEVYRGARWWLGTAAGFVGISAVLMTIVARDDQVALAFFSEGEINDLVNRSFESYYSTYAPQNFAALVWTNNTFISAIALAGGVLILPTLYLLWTNALNVGLIGGLMIGHGRADLFFGLILIHGLLELTCVFIACGVGLRIGWAWIAPGRYLSRSQALAQAGRSGVVVALGLAAPLLLSGMVEAFVTPAPVPVPIKLAVGAAVWLVVLAYLVILGARAAALGESSDVAAHERAALAPTV